MTRTAIRSGLVAAVLALGLGLQGCIPVVFATGAALGVLVGTDPRPAETMKSDIDAGGNISSSISDVFKDTAHVNVNVFNGNTLLTGEVPNAAAKARVEEIARKNPGVRKIYNEVTIGPVSTTANRLYDTQLSARVKTAVVGEIGDLGSVHLMVVTERQVVYLLGISKPDVVDRAAKAASLVSGVNQVVKMAEYQPGGPADR
ncbi:BON domain-containing protein [Amantichitinum ursilacus]|uniref:Outer membrane lipoprotein n=1 Tax=Amantichitinum ursilacus TaxID=857265 RepID=A0A0N0XJK3_9NEIS|nr:BON domain-containing protein [Amantichitinum ursilacus]KPC50814.1 outer membrane lipoprotein [Amantichitinum ursilacus]